MIRPATYTKAFSDSSLEGLEDQINYWGGLYKADPIAISHCFRPDSDMITVLVVYGARD